MSHLYQIRDKESRLIKFQRNRAQEHYNSNRHSRNLILKSRQLGFTTDEAIDSLDDVLFTRNTDALLIAHDLDSGKAIFDKKVELAWKALPPQLRELWRVDANRAQALKFEFGDGSFSSIVVDTSGRSGTFQRVHITEFAALCKKFPDRAKEIIEGTIPAIPSTGRIDIESTSQGASGEFYEMFMQAYERGLPTLPVEYKAHFYNWTWDDAELERILAIPYGSMIEGEKFREYAAFHKLSAIQITYYYQKWLSLNRNWNALRREYPTTPEEAFDAIAEGTYYGEIIGQGERDGRSTSVPHDPALKVHTVWDLGVGQNLTVGFYQRTRDGITRRIDSWQGEGSDGMPEAIAAVLNKRSYVYGKHFAPHDIAATEISTGKTRLEHARGLGLHFTIVPDIPVDDGINACQIFLSSLWWDNSRNKKWLKAIKNYCREWDEKHGMYKDKPLHNWASHFADETRYAAVVEEKMTNDDIIRRPFYDATDEIWNNGPRADADRPIEIWRG